MIPPILTFNHLLIPSLLTNTILSTVETLISSTFFSHISPP